MWRRRTGGARGGDTRDLAGGTADAGVENDGAGEPALTIDALGRKCPIPIIMLADRINEVAMRDVIAVLADDPAAFTDIPAWCRLKSHEHVASYELPQGGWSIHVRRSY
ncbi:sulfurtransferase TusA family protein [Sphaerimonospora sp. CA-214678]|uniref:sulfurtransferase TusA family protein n=1 Tax=Sphaerimonospora sp. CA-214678 TaxID=3240029 RepID=UPI003D8C18ED